MIPNIKISEILIKKLRSNKNSCYGKLFGIYHEDVLILLAIQVSTEEQFSTQENVALPGNIDLCGLISIGYNIDDNEVLLKLTGIDITDNPIFLSCDFDTTEDNIKVSILINERLEVRDYTVITEKEIHQQFVHLRLQTTFALQADVNEDSVKNEVAELRATVASGKFIFNIVKTQIFLLGGMHEIGTGLIGMSGEPNVGMLCEHLTELSEGAERKNDKRKMDILNVSMFKLMTKELLHAPLLPTEHPPICIISNRDVKTMQIPVKIDCLSILNKETKVQKLYEVLVESTIKHLKLFEDSILRSLSSGSLQIPEFYHYYPEECGHFITIFQNNTLNETDQALWRKNLHYQFLLPTVRPLFRKGNQYYFNPENCNPCRLLNPHEGVKKPLNGGKICTVRGNYLYYHYGQDREDDNGWGCAYRSLQTLASWFKLQGYVDKEVPLIKEIQECLVNIGDKPYNFIGSRQWIGSTEVNFVINSLYDIDCKIIHVGSGTELASKGSELLHHFEYYGSPVMIGGGVLAHTILGVDYNEETEAIKFLILDPHYTGEEDLQTVQNKGWCGWKGVDFWDKKSYYNLCLPIVPSEV